MTSVSYVVLTKNNERTIADCLASIFIQNVEESEIIVVDGGSTDKTLDIVKKFQCRCSEIKLINSGNIGESRQAGVESAKYDLVAFIDSDCELPYPGWTQYVVKLIDSSMVAGVWALGTYKKEYPSITRYTILSFWAFTEGIPWIVGAQNYYPVGCGHIILKKSVISEVGGFKPLKAGEDVDLTRRICNAGYVLSLTTSSVYHLHAENFKQYMAKYKRDVSCSIESSSQGKGHFIKFVLGNVVFSIPAALLGLISDRDIAWLWHPVIGAAKVYIAVTEFLKAKTQTP